MDDIGEFLVPYLPNVRLPRAGDKVYKDECCLSFDTPYSEDGLYVCLNSFLSFGRKFVEFYHTSSGNSVFLKLKKVPLPPKSDTASAPDPEQPTRLAIGVEGGFKAGVEDEVEYEDQNSIVVLPDFVEISVDRIEDIPAVLLSSVQAVIGSESESKKEEILAWDGSDIRESKHSKTLKQLDNGVRIPPTGWKCSRCDLTANLWANLTDGSILCGRKYYDGSGGNEHALQHFRETGFPLAVKLGTITPDGADVFSYDEDDMVKDSNLAQHLAHFGINMMNMEKTDKTMIELEIDINEKLGSEWEILQESGKKLNPVYGPLLTGMKNMGNTCYLNSTMQVLCSMKEFRDAYLQNYKEIFLKAIQDPGVDFNAQTTKVLLGLSSGDYSKPPEAESENDCKNNGIAPKSFKRLVGKDHVEFKSSRQQDAQEYLLHLLCLAERNSRLLGRNPTNCMKFSLEERIECIQSKMVRYSNRPEFIMSLPVPVQAATNKPDVDNYEQQKKAAKLDKSVAVGQQVRLEVPFSACLNAFMDDEIIEDFWSPALKEKSLAKKRTRFATFPRYLVIQLKKFTVGEDWVPKKLDVSVKMPDELDLDEFRSKGLQEGEVCLPDVEPPQANPPQAPQGPNVDEATVSQLVETGFPYNSCVKAVHFTGNSGAETAMNWLMEHISDPDFSDPLQLNEPEPAGAVGGAAAPAAPSSGVSEESIGVIMGMGFTREQATKALKSTDNNLERAADWIFSHVDELDTIGAGEGDNPATSASDAPNTEAMQTEESVFEDGPGKYDLMAFVSHMGTSTMCGHYVCHIKKDGKWIIFNDEKVAESEDPPISLGYLYFYKRKDD